MKYQIKAYGDRALLIEYPSLIDPDINARVLHLRQQIEYAGIKGVTFIIPAYHSLTLGYEPTQTDYGTLVSEINNLADHLQDIVAPASKVIEIPVCYDAVFALDMATISQQTNLPIHHIIALHQSVEYRVYMIGFLPGFPYLGILPSALAVNRKTNPRTVVPKGSVALAGRQTGIYPSAAPGGWQIIGRTPLVLFDQRRQAAPLLQAGDRVRFRAITASEFANYAA